LLIELAIAVLTIGIVTFANCSTIRAEADRQSCHQCNHRQTPPRLPGAGFGQFALGDLRARFCPFQFVALDPALLQGKQASTRSAALLIRFAGSPHAASECLPAAEDLEFRFPARRKWFAESPIVS